MLAAFVKSKEDSSNCIKLLGTDAPKSEGGLISHNTSLISASEDGGFDSCSFYSGPSDADIVAFCESGEFNNCVAFSQDGETCGSIAFSSSGETCGSIASSSGGGFSGGGCSYTC